MSFVKKHKVLLINFLIAAVALVIFVIFAVLTRNVQGVYRDVNCYQMSWWTYLADHGFHGATTINSVKLTNPWSLASNPCNPTTSNYTTPWYFLIAIFAKVHPVSVEYVSMILKIFSAIFVVLCATMVFFIVREIRPRTKYLPMIFAVIALFSPVFFGDILKTNLTDGIYIFFALLAYFLALKKHWIWAWFSLGVGASFKLMAVFVLPILLVMYFREFRQLNIREKLSPLNFLLAVVVLSLPNILAGGGFYDAIIGADILHLGAPQHWGFSAEWIFGSRVADVKFGSFALMAAYITIFWRVFAKRSTQNFREFLPTILVLFLLLAFYFLPAQFETYSALAVIFVLIAWAMTGKFREAAIFVLLSSLYVWNFCYVDFRGGKNLSVFVLGSRSTLSIIIYLTYRLFRENKKSRKPFAKN